MNTTKLFRFPLPVLPLALIAFLLVGITAAAPPRVEPTRETYTPLLTKEVRAASSDAWRLARCGLLKTERMVLVMGIPNDPAGAVRPVLLAATFEEYRTTFIWRIGTRATLHTHPNNVRPEPSELDIKMAEDNHVPAFVISSRGLYVYDPYFKQTLQLERGTGWMDK